jgi:uncharacterized membrane protein YidH (DUF202 family)
MDSQPHGYEWRSILLLIFNLVGAFFALSVAAILLGMFILNDRTLSVPATLTNILGATTLTAIGLLLLPAGVLSWQRLNGRKFETFRLPSLPAWSWAAIPLLWLLVMVLATLLYEAPFAVWYIPIFHFLAVAIPIYLLVRIGIHTTPLGSSQRAWAVFGSGYSLSLLLAITLEVLLAFLTVVVLGIYIGFNPGMLADMQRLANRIEAARDIEILLPILAPFIKSPLALLAALGYLSFFVPIVEEIAKSIGVWLVADRLRSPMQGFALGFLSGAGFALAESLSATLTPDSTWAITFMTRAASSCMHMLATGLTGMGIATFRLEKSVLKLVGLTSLAVLLHAAWNAGAILTVAGGLRVALAAPQVDIPGSLLALIGAGLMLVLGAGMAVALVLVNLRLRGAPPEEETTTAPEEAAGNGDQRHPSAAQAGETRLE